MRAEYARGSVGGNGFVGMWFTGAMLEETGS